MPWSAPGSRRSLLIALVGLITIFTLACLELSRSVLSRSVARAASSFMAKPGDETLQAWLQTQKQAYLADLKEGRSMSRWVLTAGNEAGDLDSMASAIGLSYMQHRFQANAGNHVPLVQTVRDDLRLRQENERALKDAQVVSEALLWLDEADVEDAFKRNAQLQLVDHNHAAPRFGSKPKVQAVIDHHQDEGLYEDAVPRVVKTGIGSCASLVTTHYAQFWQTADPSPLLTSLASLLSDSILIDTANLKNVPGKASETDYEAFGLLVRFLPSAASFASLAFSPDSRPPSDRFDTLTKLKFDVSRLSPRDLLRRDYKQFESSSSRVVGLSSVPRKLPEWDWRPALTSWAEEQRLDAAFILTSYENVKGKRRKQIAALVPNATQHADLREAVFEGFPRQGQMLKLEDDVAIESIESGGEVKTWKQTDTGPTRKQIAPAVLRALENLPSKSSS